MHYFSCVTEILRVSEHIWYRHKVFFCETTNLFTIPKPDLLSTADDMKQGMDIYLATSLYEIHSYRKRHVFKVIAGEKIFNSYGLPRGRGINLRSTLHSQMELRISCVPVCSMEPWCPLLSMATGVWYYHPAPQRWALALPFQPFSVG